MLTNFYGDMGGGEFALLAHANHLLATGFHVDVCLFRSGALADALTAAGCRVEVLRQRLDCGPRGALLVGMRLIPRLLRRFRAVGPRFVIAYTHHEMPFVVCAAQLAGVPAVFRDQGRPAQSTEEADWQRKRLARLTRRGQMMVLPTTKTQAEFLSRLGVPGERIRQVYLGVDRTPGDATCLPSAPARQALGIPPRVPLLGVFGRLIALKGHAVLFHALRQLRNSDAHLMIVGGTQLNAARGTAYLESLKCLAGELDIVHRLHFTGFRSNVQELMSACDVICSASEWETFGLSLVEAMMCGKPVVATDVSGPREIVVPGETGYLYPVGDAEALAKHLDHLLANPDLARRMGAAGRRRALIHFDQEKNLAELDRVVNEMADAHLARRLVRS